MQLRKLVALALAAALSIAAGKPATRNWNSTVTETPEGSHIVGSPDAKVKLVEYVSYTCSHCANFEVEADTQLRMGFIATGKGSIEYRSFLRNSIDIAATLLVNCGTADKFRQNHSAILRSQEKWFHEPGPAAEQRWANPDFTTAMRAIAGDLHLYEIMEGRGYSRTELDRCLADKTLAARLAEQSRAAIEDLKVEGTPSFLINGILQDAHDWNSLRPALMELTH